MATRASVSAKPPARAPTGRIAVAMAAVAAALRRFAVLLVAAALIGLAVALALALFSYSPLDASFNTVTSRTTSNWLGPVGAHVADLLLQMLGWPALALALPIGVAGVRVAQGQPFLTRRALWAVPLGAALVAAAGGAIPLPALGAPAGFGGLVGVIAGNAVMALGDTEALANVPLALIMAALLIPPGLGLIVWGAGVGLADITGLAGLGTAIAGLLPRRSSDTEDEALPVRPARAERRGACA